MVEQKERMSILDLVEFDGGSVKSMTLVFDLNSLPYNSLHIQTHLI